MWHDPILAIFGTIKNHGRYVDFDDGSGSVAGLLKKSTWGPVWPRHGFLNQGDDYKAGAVFAQRAGDFVTRDDQIHVYIPMTDQPEDYEQGQWAPPQLIEGDEDTGWWQQLIPADQDDECRVFADRSDLASGPDNPFEDRLSQNYRLCIPLVETVPMLPASRGIAYLPH